MTQTSTPRIAVIGAGRMGQNHVRVISESSDCQLAGIVDTDAVRGRRMAEQWNCQWAAELDGVAYDAAVVATPTPNHMTVGLSLLQAGVPVLVEKPLTESYEATFRLVKYARRHDQILMCGFVERFNAAFQALQAHLDSAPESIATRRHSPPVQGSALETHVAWDLLIHDADLALQLAPDLGVASAVGSRKRGGGGPEQIDALLSGATGAANLSVSRTGQRKVRELIVGTEDTLYEVDLLRQTLTTYAFVNAEMANNEYSEQTVISYPFVRHNGEPLAQQLNHFLELIEGRADKDAELSGLLPAHLVTQQIYEATR